MKLYCNCGNSFNIEPNNGDSRKCPICHKVAFEHKTERYLRAHGGMPVSPKTPMGGYEYANSDGTGGKVPARHSHW